MRRGTPEVSDLERQQLLDQISVAIVELDEAKEEKRARSLR
jgi:hypothetical protein